MSEGVVDGYPRRVWWDADGETVVEFYTITNMAHGTPLGIAENEQRYGAQGAFMIEAGISSSYHIAKFFGLTNWIRQPKAAPAKPAAPESPSARLIPMVSPMQAPPTASMPDLSKVLWPLTTLQPRPEPPKVAAAPPRHRCRRRDHARAHRSGLDEVSDDGRYPAVCAINSIGVTVTLPFAATSRVLV